MSWIDRPFALLNVALARKTILKFFKHLSAALPTGAAFSYKKFGTEVKEVRAIARSGSAKASFS